MTSMAEEATASSKQDYFNTLLTLAEYSSDDEDDNLDARPLPSSFTQLTTVHVTSTSLTEQEAQDVEASPAPKLIPNVEVQATPVLARNLTVQLPLPKPGDGQDQVNGTPLQTFQAKLRRGKVATPLSNGVSFVGETPPAAPAPAERRETRPYAAAQQPKPKSPVRMNSAPLPRLPSLLKASASNLSFSSTASKKRKRKEVVLKMAPEERQWFRGLNFFYIPPDDINPARKLRIIVALEHGATWVKEWNGGEGINYVIVDSNLTYADIRKWLKIEKWPSELILVNEQWPMDSIKYRFLVNPNQKMYEVKGYDEALRRAAEGSSIPEPATDVSQESVKSLQIKKKLAKLGRWDYVPPRQTPERSEGSSGPRIMPSQQSAFSESPDVDKALKLARAERQKADEPHRNPFSRPTSPPPVTGGRREFNSVLKAAKTLAGPSGSSKTNNAFEEAISEARRLEGVPLDDSDDESPSHGSSKRSNLTKSLSNGHYGDDFTASERQKLNTSTFSCMTGGSLATPESGPNSRTIQILQEMADYYTRINDTWRPIAYRKAINTLKRQTTKISTSGEAMKLPNVGQRLADKIEEIVLTDRLRRLETTKNDPADETLRLFLGVYGVGIKQASQWLAQGCRTLDDLEKHVKLSENQLLGIEHYEDFATRILRKEVEALGKIVQGEAKKIDKDVVCIIGGSYRRGAETCGDIDLLVTKLGTQQTSDLARFLSEIVGRLRTMGVLVAALSVGHTEDSPKWHGACVLPPFHGGKEPGVWRRIDFHLAPESEIGAALIYFTGNDIFNRSMRLLAKKKGMRLNQRGLFRNVMGGRGPNGQSKTTDGQLVEGRSERRIFEILGVPWKEPTERVC